MSTQQSRWLDVLREACAASSQQAIAKRLEYSVSVINAVLKGKYKGDLKRVQAAVEGALMAAEVDCPILGQLAQQRCVQIQRQPFSAGNPTDVQLYRACRGGCAHSLSSAGGAAPPASSAVVTKTTAASSSSGGVTP